MIGFMSEIYHHSGDCRFRQHPRALKTQEQTVIRIWTGGTAVRSVLLRLYQNGGQSELPMTFSEGYWETTVTAPKEPTVLWYDFALDTSEGQLFYGATLGETAGPGHWYEKDPRAFQITVQADDFCTPSWAKEGILYQIFPDRFRRGAPSLLGKGAIYREQMKRKTLLHSDWTEEVLYLPVEGEEYYAPIDFYGGDFKGIMEEFPRLKELGVSVLYLNPISEALSNHRYDTADYNNPDPFLGNNEDFMKLTSLASAFGMRVILDGVYSHTGADSIYFNRAQNYPLPGGWQSEPSPYDHWYSFSEDRKSYRCWWGFPSLPEVNELSPDWQEFVICGEDSVIRSWLKKGASGFRLDVADELPDEVIELIREAVKSKREDGFIIGEVWEDATIKQSYGENRKYALGKGLDSVMNYPFRNGCIGYLLGWQNAISFRQLLLTQQINYPKEMYYALMNLLSSHDIPRVRTVLSLGREYTELSREEQAKITPDSGQDIHGGILQRLAVGICYALPGLPSIYYGDEYGMHGLRDPFNRRPLQRRDPETETDYREMAKLRNNHSVLRTGFAQFHATEDNLLAIHRFLIGGADAFGKRKEGNDVLALFNPDCMEKNCDITLLASGEGIDAEDYERMREKRYTAMIDLKTGEQYRISGNRITLTLSAESSRWFCLVE